MYRKGSCDSQLTAHHVKEVKTGTVGRNWRMKEQVHSLLLACSPYLVQTDFFLFFLTFSDSVDFTLCFLISLISPPLTSALCLCILPPPKPKPNLKESPKTRQNKSNKSKQKKGGENLVMGAVLWLSESHSLPFNPLIFTWSHWSDLRPLVSAEPQIMGPHWGSSRISCWAVL